MMLLMRLSSCRVGSGRGRGQEAIKLEKSSVSRRLSGSQARAADALDALARTRAHARVRMHPQHEKPVRSREEPESLLNTQFSSNLAPHAWP